VAQIRTDAQSLIQTKRAQFQQQVATIKDQVKKTLVEKIDARLTQVNANQTTMFTNTLGRLQTFIDNASKSAMSQLHKQILRLHKLRLTRPAPLLQLRQQSRIL